jgi:excisionase family DNA binding protein
MKTWLNVAEAAEYAGVSRDTIYTACEARLLRHVRVGGRRAIRLRREWLDEWFESHTRETVAQESRDAARATAPSAMESHP